MLSLMLDRLAAIWLFLIGATMLSIEFTGDLFAGRSVRTVTVAVLLVAFVKVRLVALEFMELRYAPTFARFAFETWLVVIFSSMIGMYLLGISV
jgi:hypothetical protein